MTTNYFIHEKETTKLFYNEYLYKLVLRNNLVSIFRGQNFTYARQQLDILQTKYENGDYLKLDQAPLNITVEQFVGAKFLLTELDNQKKYKIRIEIFIPYLRLILDLKIKVYCL